MLVRIAETSLLPPFLKTVKDKSKSVTCVDKSGTTHTKFNYLHNDINLSPQEFLIILFYINSPKLLKHGSVKPNQHRI